MCAPFETVPLDAIPPLEHDAFMDILQSLLHHQQGLGCTVAPQWLCAQDFAQQRWKDCTLTPQALERALKAFENMFAVTITPTATDTMGDICTRALRQWQLGPQNITFHTSGSTGIPKACTHHESHLRQELMSIVPLCAQYSGVLVTVPLHHLYGFTFGVLLPRALRVPVRADAPLPTIVAKHMHSTDIVVGIPLLWDKFLQLERRYTQGSLLVSATAPLAETTLRRLLQYGFTCLEIFGSSETGVFCLRQKADTPFTLLPHFTAMNKNGIITVVRTLPDGTSAPLPLQDNLAWLDARHVRPLGRKDYAVQVGGINVFPGRVAACLEKHPAVKLCTVRLMRPDEGQRLKAFVVPQDTTTGLTQLRKQLHAFAKGHLTPAERPVQFSFGDALPRNSVGKLTDW